MASITIFNLSTLVIVYIRDFTGQISYFILLRRLNAGRLKLFLCAKCGAEKV